MKARVRRVISDVTIELNHRWEFHDTHGNRVKIAGLLPSSRDVRDAKKEELANLIHGKIVVIDNFLYVAGDTLCAIVHLKGQPVQDFLPDRKILTVESSRWADADENRLMNRVFGGIPSTWCNPIRKLKEEDSPFFGNINYPTKPWNKEYKRVKTLADALYVDDYANKRELDVWFERFLASPPMEAPMVIVGEVGVGKSWFLAHKLTSLPKRDYHVILIDLRYRLKGKELERSIHREIHEYLNYYISDLSWLYPDFEATLGKNFNPRDPEMQKQMEQKALQLNVPGSPGYNELRIRYYNRPGAPQLIVAFDNIDHYDIRDQETVADICRRIVGNPPGVKVIITVRPSTKIRKSRLSEFFGDTVNKPVVLKSPDVYKVIRKRLSTNSNGEALNLKRLVEGDLAWQDILRTYEESHHAYGLAYLVLQLCCTERLGPGYPGPSRAIRPPVRTLSTYDCRHYIKLFRRIIRSRSLLSFRHIGNVYFGIQALMLRAGEPMSEGDAYLFNLFDNEQPRSRGNALVRYRVLEYCRIFNDLGELFDIFFGGLGCGESVARDLILTFEEAGLIEVERSYEGDGPGKPISARLTVPGRRHFELITNLWYIICAKTGINIFEEFILYGEHAIREASEFVQSSQILEYYASHGWVSEKGFIEFIGMQEYLEYRRIAAFEETHPKWKEQIRNMMQYVSSPAENLHWSYNEQIRRWRDARSRRPFQDLENGE